jgi:hypothetical protein
MSDQENSIVGISAPERRAGLIAGISIGATLVIGLASGCSSSGNGTPAAATQSSLAATASGQSSPTAAAPSGASSTSAASADSGSVSIPRSAGGLTQLTGSAGAAVVAAMKQADSANAMLKSGAIFGAYAKSGSSTYFANLTLLPLSASPSFAQEAQAAGSTTVLAAIVQQQKLTDLKVETPAVSGAALTCGRLSSAAITLRMCEWVDGQEYGLATFPDTVSDDQGATYAEGLWRASEGE